MVRATMSGGPTYSGTFSAWLEIPRLRLAAIGAAVVVLAILVLRNMLPRLRLALVAALALLTVYLAVWLAALVYIQLG